LHLHCKGNDECGMINDELKTNAFTHHSSFRIHHLIWAF